MSQKTLNQPVNLYSETHTKELSERFGRLIKKLGPVNKKGSLRYNYEVEFMYALNEIMLSPPYLQGMMFENANNVINSLVNLIQLKQNSDKGSRDQTQE